MANSIRRKHRHQRQRISVSVKIRKAENALARGENDINEKIAKRSGGAAKSIISAAVTCVAWLMVLTHLLW